MTALTELAFPAMGTSVRLLAAPGAPLEDARALIEDLEARLTRFDSASELSVLNADPRETVPASRTLRDAVRVRDRRRGGDGRARRPHASRRGRPRRL